MAVPAEDILQFFFNASTLAGVSQEQLQQLADEQPFYGVAQFLLAKKLYQSKQDGYEQALQKAALHFPNELMLHFNLEEDGRERETTTAVAAQTPVVNLQADEDEEIFEEQIPL